MDTPAGLPRRPTSHYSAVQTDVDLQAAAALRDPATRSIERGDATTIYTIYMYVYITLYIYIYIYVCACIYIYIYIHIYQYLYYHEQCYYCYYSNYYYYYY